MNSLPIEIIVFILSFVPRRLAIHFLGDDRIRQYAGLFKSMFVRIEANFTLYLHDVPIIYVMMETIEQKRYWGAKYLGYDDILDIKIVMEEDLINVYVKHYYEDDLKKLVDQVEKYYFGPKIANYITKKHPFTWGLANQNLLLSSCKISVLPIIMPYISADNIMWGEILLDEDINRIVILLEYYKLPRAGELLCQNIYTVPELKLIMPYVFNYRNELLIELAKNDKIDEVLYLLDEHDCDPNYNDNIILHDMINQSQYALLKTILKHPSFKVETLTDGLIKVLMNQLDIEIMRILYKSPIIAKKYPFTSLIHFPQHERELFPYLAGNTHEEKIKTYVNSITY